MARLQQSLVENRGRLFLEARGAARFPPPPPPPTPPSSPPSPPPPPPRSPHDPLVTSPRSLPGRVPTLTSSPLLSSFSFLPFSLQIYRHEH